MPQKEKLSAAQRDYFRRRKIARVLHFLDSGGTPSEAARIFGYNRSHIYRLIDDRDAAEQKENFDAPAVARHEPEPYSTKNIKGRALKICLNAPCHRLYFVPHESDYVDGICSERCFVELVDLKEKTDAQKDALLTARKTTARFAASEEDRESAEVKRAELDKQPPRVLPVKKPLVSLSDDFLDISDLIE